MIEAGGGCRGNTGMAHDPCHCFAPGQLGPSYLELEATLAAHADEVRRLREALERDEWQEAYRLASLRADNGERRADAAEAAMEKAEKARDEAIAGWQRSVRTSERAEAALAAEMEANIEVRMALRAENARLREALAPFCDPASYTTDEQECRRNPAMDWCAVHSFRWPCPVGPARAALAAAEKGGEK